MLHLHTADEIGSNCPALVSRQITGKAIGSTKCSTPILDMEKRDIEVANKCRELLIKAKDLLSDLPEWEGKINVA